MDITAEAIDAIKYTGTLVVGLVGGWLARKSYAQKMEMARDALEIAEGHGTVHDFVVEHVLDGEDDDK